MYIALKPFTEKYPATFAIWASTILKSYKGLTEIVVAGQNLDGLRVGILKKFIPHMVFQSSNVEKNYPLLKSKDYTNDGLIYVCENFSCAEPVDNIKDFEKIMNY